MLASKAEVEERDVSGAYVRVASGRWGNTGANGHDAAFLKMDTIKRRALYAVKAVYVQRSAAIARANSSLNNATQLEAHKVTTY